MAQPQSITDLKDTGVTVAPEDTINEILPFCAQGQEGRDLLSQAEYAQDMQRNIGHQPGIARAKLANKQARQVSHMAAGLAQFLARRYAPGVVDDGDLDKVEAALVGALDAVIKSPAHLATLLRAGLMQPDGVTTTVDEDGLLSALGGNLLLNSELRITESGTFEAPVDGWYDILLIGGGQAGSVSQSTSNLYGGISGEYLRVLRYLEKNQQVAVTVGAGGTPNLSQAGAASTFGGNTSFGADTALGGGQVGSRPACQFRPAMPAYQGNVRLTSGAGPGGGPFGYTVGALNATYYGGGGGATYHPTAANSTAGNGYQGAVIVRWHDPAKAAGPQPEPALFWARRMARAVAEPAAVNLYDPETGQGSVWREEDAEARLAEGLITEEAWTEICAARAAEAHAAWLADPATSAGRFELLRQARDARLAATDYLVAPDYPLSEDQRARVTAYRQALRDLPAQAGAPWDGGGEATPWPEMPAVAEAQEI